MSPRDWTPDASDDRESREGRAGRLDRPDPQDQNQGDRTQDDGLDTLFDASAAAALRGHWAEQGVTVRAQAEPWRRSGHSGARLGMVVLGHPDRPDERIVVKLLPAGPDTRETDRHDRARASAPEFTDAHVVAQAYPPHDLSDGRRLMFQRLPHASAEVMPLGAALNGELAESCQQLVRSLFDSWNPDRALRGTTVGEFVATELRSAMEPGRSAPAWARDVLMVDAGAGRWVRDEEDPNLIVPNPALITASGNPIGALPLDCFLGRAHGDLHLENVLVARRDGRPWPGQHWLIDLAHYEEGVPLSRDVAALVLALVSRRVADLPAGSTGEADALIDVVIDPTIPVGQGIGAGVIDAIRAVDEACRESLPGDREVWRAQYLWSVVAQALVHTSFESAGERVRWWYSRLAAHAARAALDEARRRTPGAALPSAPPTGDIPLAGPREAARRARSAPARVLRTRAEVVAAVRGRLLLPEELPFFRKAPTLTPDALTPKPGSDQLPIRTVLLGAPGTGKSRWCLEVAARAEEAGSPVFFLGGIDGGSAELLPLSTEEVVEELTAALDGAAGRGGGRTGDRAGGRGGDRGKRPAEERAGAPAAGAAPAPYPLGSTPGGTPTTSAARTALLVIDGLDRFPGLNLPGLHDALIELAYRGRPVALLATSRHGTHWTSQLGRGAASLLPVEMHLPSAPEYRGPLLRSVLRRSAPRTVRALGASAVLAALHNDPDAPLAPGVAVMWSRVLERTTEATEADQGGGSGGSGGATRHAGSEPALLAESLPEALHRALQGVPSDPETVGRLVLLPMAAVLAAAPLPPDRLVAIADTALSATARSLNRTAPRAGEEVVRCLRETGLLHLDPTQAGARGAPDVPDAPGTSGTEAPAADAAGVLVVSHPLACDAFLNYATLCGVEGPGLGIVLGATAGDVRAIANTAASITRWYPTAPGTVRDQFDQQAGLWLSEHAPTLGRTLATAGPGGASVLEFLLYTRPWHKLTYVHWRPLAGPWFERPEASRVDPLLLARALYEDRNEDRVRIINLAFGWLERHAREPVAALVLRWLLRRHETRDAIRDRALALADEFLRANPDVRPNHVLAAALVQHGVDPDRTGPLAQRALAELREEPGAETNAPLLAALLSRRDTEERVLAEALVMGKAHLTRHPLAPSSNEVLKWLLVRPELSAADHREATVAADAWFAENATHPHASHVLSGVLLDRRGTEPHQRAAAALAVDWLELNWRRRPAIWVLTDLMNAQKRFEEDPDPEQPLLPDSLRPRLAAVTCRWLKQWDREDVTPDTAAKVLRLTHRTDAGPDLARAVLAWAKEHSGQNKAFPALIAALNVSGPGLPLGAEAMGPAMKWLRTHHRQEGASGVLQELLQREGLEGDEARTAYTYALTWLDRYRDSHQTDTHVARRLLLAFKRQAPKPEQLAAAVDHVVALLDRLEATPRTPLSSLHVHVPMLRAALEQQPDPERTTRLLQHAWRLLVDNDLSGQRGMLLQSLLGPRGLPAEFVAKVVAYALPWLEALAGTEQAGYALKGLVRRKEITAGSEAHTRMCAAARLWLTAHPEHPETGSLVGMLLARDDIDPLTGRVAVEAGTAWLSTEPTLDKAALLLARLLPLTRPDDGRAIAFALTALREEPHWRSAVLVLSGLLRSPGLSEGESARVREQALTLVADHQYERMPGLLMQRLLDRDDLGEQEERNVMEHARGWWNHHHELASAPYLAEAMFARPRHLRRRIGHRTWEERMVDDLVDWLAAEPIGIPNEWRGSLPTAVRLVKDRRLAARQKKEIAERVDHWLTARPGDPDAPELARWVVDLVDEANRADPFGAGLAVAPDVLDRVRAVANGEPPPRPEPEPSPEAGTEGGPAPEG